MAGAKASIDENGTVAMPDQKCEHGADLASARVPGGIQHIG
jgi:hypothetical protein